MLSSDELRREICTRRRRLTKKFIQSASKQLLANILDLPEIQNRNQIAGYFANNGEIDPMPIAAKLCEQKKTYYLPVLDTNKPNHLIFVHYRPGDPLFLNRYKIPEPDSLNQNKCPPECLDIVLMPLVAFDKQGGRLGMGAGYYDRTFAFTKQLVVQKPLLIGLAYAFQCVDQLDCNAWDVPLDKVITEEKVYTRP